MTNTTQDTRIQELRRQATSGDPEAVSAFERAMVRAGLDEDLFHLQAEALRSALEAAQEEVNALRDKRVRLAAKTYEEIHPTGERVCVRCGGSGYTKVRVRSDHAMIDTGNRICTVCVESYGPGQGWGEYSDVVRKAPGTYPTVLKEDKHALGVAEAKARTHYRVDSLVAEAKLSAANKALRPYAEAMRLSRGAEVSYVRGRASFEGGGKVPHGTLGHLFYVRDSRVGLRTEAGEVFWTSASNLDPKVLNCHLRMSGEDLISKQDEERAQAKLSAQQDDQRAIEDTFGEQGPVRGSKCELHGSRGKVFWTGHDKKTGRLKIGIRRRLTSKTDPITWGFAADALPTKDN